MADKSGWKLPDEPVERYAVIAAILVVALMTTATVWELYFANNPSFPVRVTKIIGWTGPSSAITAIVIIILEAHAVVTRQKYLNKGREEGREEGRQQGQLTTQKRWEEWNHRRLEATAKGVEFTEPAPTIDP